MQIHDFEDQHNISLILIDFDRDNVKLAVLSLSAIVFDSDFDKHSGIVVFNDRGHG